MRFSWIPVLALLPKNLISQAFGIIARLRVPLFSTWFKNWFVQHFKIDMSDSLYSQSEFPTVQDLFVRELKPGSRPIDTHEVVSPVDGKLSQVGYLDDPSQTMIQAKGKFYTLGNLLRNQELASKYLGGAYAVIYLAPFNYHRIHSPFDGELIASYYCPGTLWPVNEDSVSRIEGLFCINERATSHIKFKDGEGLLVKVGATNVGRIAMTYPSSWVSNTSRVPSRFKPVSTWKPDHLITIKRGDQLGVFELGSTVVIVVDANVRNRYPNIFASKLGKNVRMGEGLC